MIWTLVIALIFGTVGYFIGHNVGENSGYLNGLREGQHIARRYGVHCWPTTVICMTVATSQAARESAPDTDALELTVTKVD